MMPNVQKTTFFVAVAALAVAILALFRPAFQGAGAAPQDAAPASPDVGAWRAERQYPPLVFTSKAWLDCSISSTENGRQIMRTTAGQGFTFDATMSPIKDGKVKLQNPGMLYKFDSFPTARVPARFNGLGEGTIIEMKAEVEVDVKRFQQPGGPGTSIHFNASDIRTDAAYVEFTGVWVRNKDNKRFPFRVLFGSVADGEGTVTPTSRAPDTNIAAKMVTLGSVRKPASVTTALYEAEDDVRDLE
jgi:hypothetical protein